ncbi:MAG: hypothetical protein AAGC71_06650 [Pseudomonadota bacterium]
MFKYTEKKFAKDVGRVAATIDPSLSYEYLPASREVKLTSNKDDAGKPINIFLGNIFLKVSALPKRERIPTIRAFLTEVLTPKKLSPDELMGSLALRVRTDFEIDYRNRHLVFMGHEAPPSIVVRRGDVLVEIVADREESVSIARSDDLAEIGVDADQAFRMAAAKIRRSTDNHQWEQVDDAIWMSRYQDDYDFARLIAAEDSGKFPFDGAPIVFAPSHSICLATSSTDVDVLHRMVDLGSDHAANHRPFCQLLWTIDEGAAWQAWTPTPNTDAYAVAQTQALRETMHQYAESKDYLEKSLGEEDVFVATFQAIQNDEGLASYSVYTLDVPSYLPLADFVVIFDPELPEDEAVVGRIDWDEFAKIVGAEFLEPIDGLIPAWYRILQPLDASQKTLARQSARPL